MKIKHRFKKVIIVIEGIYSISCIEKIEKAFKTMGGIDYISVHLISKIAIIKYDEDSIRIDNILNKIKELGYTPVSVMENYIISDKISNTITEKEKVLFFRKFILSTIFSMGIIYGDFLNFSQYTLFLLSGFVWLYCGWYFHKGFFYSLKNRSADINTLISLSTTTAFIYSFFISFTDFFKNINIYPHWYDSAILIAFVNLGKYLESISKSKIKDPITAITKILPKFSVLITENGEYKIIKSSDIKKGDRLLIKSGQHLPTDGRIIKGNSIFEELIFSEENFCIQKGEGDFIYAGSLNKGEQVEIIAENALADSHIVKVAKLIKENNSIKINIQKNLNKIVSIFIPIIIALAFFSATFWLMKENIQPSIIVFSSILILACPAAIAISVPIALIIGFIKGKKLGFLINNPYILENFEKIDTIIFDNKGLITYGIFKISEIEPYKISEEEFMKFLFTTMLNSNDIFSKAIKKYCLEKDIFPYELKKTYSFPYKGIKTEAEDFEIIVGNMEFLFENKIKIPPSILKEIEKIKSNILLLAVNNKYKGYLVFSDFLRENIKDTINEFKKRGIEPVIVSDDKKEILENIARKLEIKDYYSEVNPLEKHTIVVKYKALRKKVMTIGNGINDAVFINESDIGISIKQPSAVVINWSDVVLLKNDMSLLLKFLDLSKYIKKIIKQNIFFAFLYNIILIPVVTGLLFYPNGFFLKPYIVVLTMGLSIVSVFLNSLRILTQKFQSENF